MNQKMDKSLMEQMILLQKCCSKTLTLSYTSPSTREPQKKGVTPMVFKIAPNRIVESTCTYSKAVIKSIEVIRTTSIGELAYAYSQ